MTSWSDWFVNLFLWVQTWEELMEREEYGIFQCQGSSCALVNGIYDIYALLCKQNCCVPGWGSRAHLPKGAAETNQAEHGLTDLCMNQSCCCLCRNHHLGNSILCPLLDLYVVAPVPGISPLTYPRQVSSS